MSKPRIYFDDCERFNGTDYFPYHYFDAQWTWMPKTPGDWYCYSPKFDTDARQGNTSILISNNIYRIAEGFWPSELQGWILNGTEWNIAGHLAPTEAGGIATFTFLDDVAPNGRDLKGIPGLGWNLCSYGAGIGANNNFYMISDSGAKIGIHNRTEFRYNPYPIFEYNHYSYITVNGVVQDSWYQLNGDSPSASWSYLNRIGDTWSYIIKHDNTTTLATISATVSLSEIRTLKYVAPTVDWNGYNTISIGYWWNYTKSYGTSYIYKNLYDAGIDQQYLMFCNKIWFAIKSNKVGTYLKFCLGYNTWDEWEYDITINEANEWEWKSIDITNIPYSVIKEGFKYVGFKYIHNELETEYDNFIFRYDAIYADPGDVNYWVEDVGYAFIM